MSVPSIHDRYDLIRPIAQGGMAKVMLAREVDTGREVALKLLALPEGARLEEWKLRFQHEFHTTARLRHPHIVATYDYGQARDGTPFYTMEYLPGPGFEEIIPLAPEKVQAYVPGLLAGLGSIHVQGFCHNDIKPENIRLATDGTVRLMDLGLVSRAGQSAPGVQGTLPYLAPEMIRRAPLDRRSDLYSLGAVLYHLLAGRAPFAGEPREVLRGHLEGTPPDLRELVPGIPEQLAALVHRMLAKEPLQRFQSAQEALVFLGAAGSLDEDRTLFHAPVIGRADELAELAAGLERARAGAYEEAWLHGDPDVGLVACLDEFCFRAQMAGATVVRGAFRPRSAPFEGLRPVVLGLYAHARQHAEALATALPVLARVAPELGVAPAPETADPQQERLRLFEALTQLVRLGGTGGPVVLAFPNAHHAGAAFKDWLEYVRRNGAQLPLLIVCAYAGEPELDFDPCRSEIALAPLGPEESHEACCAILGQLELSGRFSRQVHDMTGGYPHRLETLLKRLVEAGRLVRAQGVWQVPEDDLSDVFATLDPAWAEEQRFKRLPPLGLALLEALAVLGRDVELYMLAQVVQTPTGTDQLSLAHALPEDGGELFEALRLLEEDGWVQSGQGQCRLGPGQDREALLARMGEGRKRQVHGAITRTLARAIEQAPGDLGLLSELASHGLASADRRAPGWALEAARRHARLFGLEEAEDLLASAIAQLEAQAASRETALALHRLRADVARLAGDRRLAAQAYEAAHPLALQLGDAEALAGLENGRGRLQMDTGDVQAAEGHFRAVLDRLGAATVHPEAALAQTLLGRLALTRGDLAEASRWVEQALAAARQSGDRGLVRENMAQLGYLYVASEEDRAAEGLALLFDALQMTEKDEAKLELNACYALLGNAQLLLGRFTEAKLAFQRNCDLCAEIGAAPHDEATAFMRRAQVELELGDYRSVKASTGPAGALARMIGNRLLLAQVRLIEGMAALYQGDFTIYQDATLLVTESLALPGSDYLQAMWHTYRAEAEGFLGQWQNALSSAGAALEVIGRGAGHEFWVRAQLVKGEALTRLGLFKPARATLEAVAAPRNEALLARLLLAQAQLERQDGQRDRARVLAARALELARRTGVVPVAAACCLLLARVAPAQEEALTWCRKALLDAEVCGQSALEAEALYLAHRHAGKPAEAEWFFTAAEDAWRRATAGLTAAILEPFGATEDRKPLREALRARQAEGYRLTADDQASMLRLLALPPSPDVFVPAILAFCREAGAQERIGLFWEDAHGTPVLVAGTGLPLGGHRSAQAELEAAQRGGHGVVLHPLDTHPEGERPWGALLASGLTPERADRLGKLLAFLGGAAWACREQWLARADMPWEAERSVPAAGGTESSIEASK